MLLHCPVCQAAFPGVSRCPRCGGLLLMPHEVSPDAARHTSDAPAPLRPTAAGRIAVGTLLALGFYLAVRKLALGVVLATEADPATWWHSFKGLALIHAAQGLAVGFGAIVASAGREKGFSLGMAVGAACGGLFLGYEIRAGAPARDLVFYLQLPTLAALGLIAGAVGSRIWGAAPKLDIPIPNSGKLSSLAFTEEATGSGSRPTLWVRVLGGAVIMILGVAIADQFRTTVQKNSGGILRVASLGQGEFITWQIATFTVLLGGIAAGAGTGAGIRHGLIAGLLGGAGVVGVCVNAGGTVPAVEYWLVQLSLNDLPLTAPAVLVAVAGGVLLLSVVGGWLGGTLFLPLAPAHMRGKLRIGMD